MRPTYLLLSLALVAGTLACDQGDIQRLRGSAAVAPRPTAGVVDSALSIDEHLRRFRADLAEQPSTLADVARDRDSLVAHFVRAVAATDSATLRELVLTRAEFAYLFYPENPQSRPPYELEPALMWYQLTSTGAKGIGRTLRAYGGTPLAYESHRCDRLDRQGANRVHMNCAVRVRVGSAPAEERILFGSIVERDGRFKFVSYAGKL